MGKCSECRSYEAKRADYVNDRYVRHWCCYLKRSVDPYGSCNNFSQKPTADNSGYTDGYGRRSGCFLTSACVEFMGKTDDCEELTTLRKFRDGYMKGTDAGSSLVEEYYSVAPTIVEKINASGKANEYYANIYEIIKLCVKLIDANEYEKALTEYKAMVLGFKKEFNL